MISSDVSIKLESVSFGFQGIRILENISLEVPAGERVALLGASGSGKTTLLKIMAGLDGYRPWSGNCFRSGRMAMVFQQPLLLDYYTVQRNIELPARIQHRRPDIAAVVNFLGLQTLLTRYPYQLSGGQQRRVALGRALATPGATGLLLDEALTGLDEPLRERILTELEAGLNATGLTCVFATHSPLEAAFLADRVLFLGRAPASIAFEYKVRLPRGARTNLLDKQEFFAESTAIRSLLNEHSDAATSALD